MEPWTKFLETLRHLPLRIFVALAVGGTFVLYSPPIAGLNLDAARSWPWIGPATVLAWCFVVFLVLARAFHVALHLIAARVEAGVPASLRLTMHPQANTTFWVGTLQADGSVTTQISIDVSAHNPTARTVRIEAARLIRPSVAVALLPATTFMVSDPDGSGMHSPNYPIRPRGTSSVRVGIMVRKKLAEAGRFLPVTIGLTDQNGHEHRIKVRLWPTPVAS